MSRACRISAVVLLAVLALAGCGVDTTPLGPLGISGSGWFVLIMIGLFVIGGAVSDLAARGRRERRDRDKT